MNIIEAHAWKCANCKRVYAEKTVAEECCLCRRCKTSINATYGHCRKCSDEVYAENQAKRMEKAEIVEDTGEFVYSQDGGGQDGYHCNMEDFIDYLWDKFNCDEARTEEQIKEIEAQWPEFVFACEPSGLKQIGIDDIIERASDDMHEDFDCDLEGMDIVERVLKDFYAKNAKIVTWYSDEKKKIRVPSFRDLKRENDIKRAELKKAVM